MARCSAALCCCAAVAPAAAASSAGGPLRLRLRRRALSQGAVYGYTREEIQAEWDPAETAVMIIDLWDRWGCPTLEERMQGIAATANRTAWAMRAAGALVIHAPADSAIGHYDGYAERKWVRALPNTTIPPRHPGGAPAARAPPSPVPDCDVGATNCGCDSPFTPTGRSPTRQSPLIDIVPGDAISAPDGWWPDRSQELWNIVRARGIKHVLFLGVASNMCILNRPFGVKAALTMGLDTVVLRDATTVAYNPLDPPYVTHEQAAEIVIDYIESFWAPTTTVFDVMQAWHHDH